MQKISTFDVFGRWATSRFTIVEKNTQRTFSSDDFAQAFFKMFSNLVTFRDEYNSVVDLFNRLSPTQKTLFFVYIKETYKKHFDELNLAELSTTKTWILNRIK